MNIRNSTPKTYEEKLARASNKVTKAIRAQALHAQEADAYFWHLVDWAFIRVNEKDSRENLTFLKDVSTILHQRTQPKEGVDLSGLEALIRAKLEKMNPQPDGSQ